MRLQFTLIRLLLAITVFALMMGLMKYRMDHYLFKVSPAGATILSLMVAGPVAGLVILANRKNALRIIISGMGGGAGFLIPLDNGAAVFSILGWFLGCLFSRLIERDEKKNRKRGRAIDKPNAHSKSGGAEREGQSF